jgi:hypothetical protein
MGTQDGSADPILGLVSLLFDHSAPICVATGTPHQRSDPICVAAGAPRRQAGVQRRGGHFRVFRVYGFLRFRVFRSSVRIHIRVISKGLGS